MNQLGEWKEVIDGKPIYAFLPVEYNSTSLWLYLVWAGRDPFKLFLCKNVGNEPGKIYDYDLFGGKGLHFVEVEFTLAEFAAVDVAKEWLDQNWPVVKDAF
jgi:hypothetical protein